MNFICQIQILKFLNCILKYYLNTVLILTYVIWISYTKYIEYTIRTKCMSKGNKVNWNAFSFDWFINQINSVISTQDPLY